MQIKEVAKRLQITPRAIRFYEEKGLLSPAKMESSGYRQFTEEDVWRLQTIVTLREVGMPIEDIKQLMGQLDGESGQLSTYLELQRSYMYDRWVELKNVIHTTEAMIEQVKQNSGLEPAALYELADANKRLRQTRKDWVDRWNFNQIANVYDSLVREKQGFNPHHGYDQVLDQVVEYASPQNGEKGLDAGTGTGNLASRFGSYPIEMCAFDQSVEMLKICKAKNPHVKSKVGSFFAIPYLDHSFDFVVTSYALHHLSDEQKCLAFAEFERVLKQNGRLVIADLMFEDEAVRKEHLQSLHDKGLQQAIAEIEDEYYADKSIMLGELDRLGFRSETVQLNTYVHLLYARKS